MIVATANIPPRLGPHKADMQRLADQGAAIICTQEDADSRQWVPRGWRRWRPKRARSTAIYYDPRVVTIKRKGAKRLSSVGFSSLRYGVWAQFRTPLGSMRVMSVHLPAFYASSAKRRAEYDRQARKVAAWAARKPNRVVAGDYNGSVGGQRMAPLVAVMDFSEPVASGPKGTKIDYVAVAKGGRFRVARTRLGAKGRSDHRPVLATLGRSGE